MALVRKLKYQALTLDMLNEALQYVGGKVANIVAVTGDAPGTQMSGFRFYIGDNSSESNLIAWYAGKSNTTTSYGTVCEAGASSNGSDRYGCSVASVSDTITIVATKFAFAITNIDSSGVSRMGLIITTDDQNDYCCVTVGGNVQTLSNPYIVPRNPLYTSAITYGATTSVEFGCTSLALLPVPTYGSQARWIPNVAFASSTQFVTDGPVALQTTLWYTIGGSWYLADGFMNDTDE